MVYLFIFSPRNREDRVKYTAADSISEEGLKSMCIAAIKRNTRNNKT